MAGSWTLLYADSHRLRAIVSMVLYTQMSMVFGSKYWRRSPDIGVSKFEFGIPYMSRAR